MNVLVGVKPSWRSHSIEYWDFKRATGFKSIVTLMLELILREIFL